MSVQEQIAPYLNRFVLLLNQNATVKLEINCKEGRVNVNMSHDLGNVAHPNPLKVPVPKPGYNEVLKKNVPPSQIYRLQKRAAARAEQANVQLENQRKIANEALKNPAYGRHRISRPMRIIGPIQFFFFQKIFFPKIFFSKKNFSKKNFL